jgi:hypothetical protein
MNKNRSMVGLWGGLRGWVFGCWVVGTVLGLTGCREAEGEGRLRSTAPAVSVPAPPIPDLQPLLKRLQTYDGARDLTAEMRLTATRAGGRPEQIDLRLQRRIDPEGTRTFLQVLAPLQERDKVLLAIEETDKPTVALSYLAGLRRLARLSSSRQLTFREAKVTVQELLGMELSGYQAGTPERVDDEGTPRLRLRLQELPDRALAFPRIDLYLDEEGLQPVRFELFDDGGALQKRIQVEEVQTIQSRQTLTKLSIDDPGQQLRMILEIRRVEYDRGLPESAFTEERLKQVTTEAGRQIDARREAP